MISHFFTRRISNGKSTEALAALNHLLPYSRNVPKPLLFLALICAICSLLCGCDLLNAPTKPDYFKNIDAEIAWANADRLTVRVDYPPEWGSSPQQGDLNRDNTRRGYAFAVEFTPLPGYGFEKWLAFPSAEYSRLDKTQSAAEAEAVALNGNGVVIETSQSASGATIALVTIFYADTPVAIVPWCNSRPALDQRTNPPLSPILTAFPYDQRVNIWFTIPVNTETVTLAGESPTIRIAGVWASGTERGQSFNRNGEKGDLRDYFAIEFPDPPDPAKPQLNNRATLVPRANASEIALVAITITVGPGIESSSGVAMAVPGTISYQTNTSQARVVYRAGNVQAREVTTGDYFREAEFSRPDIDRRFTQNGGSGKNRVEIRFDVAAPEGAPDANPNQIIIVERRLYSLRGFDLNPGSDVETSYAYPGPGVSLTNNSFTIAHTLKTEQSGIVQLAVLPWYDGIPIIEEMPIHEAIAEGRYVTIVMDNAAPDAENPQAVLSGDYQLDGEVHVYGTGVEMTLTLEGLSGIVDNGIEGGIPANRAYSLPWTMDEAENLYWYAMIGENAATAKIQMPDPGSRKPVYSGSTLNNSWTLPNLSDLDEGTVYRIYVKYEDALGNIMPTWTSTGLMVLYSTAAKESVSNVKAFCNTAGNSVTVSYTEPPGWASVSTTYPYPEIVITTYRASPNGDMEEGTQTIARSRGATAFSFTVPQIVSNRVREGDAVSTVYGYKISVVTHNIAGPMTTEPIWVYNIPDMATAQTAVATDGVSYLTLEHLDSTITGSLLSGNKNFVLANSTIVLSSHDPIGGDGISTNPPPFQGKFYGNGHTVTINGMNTASEIGLFSVVSGTTTNPAIIRDLTVVYNNVDINNSTTTRIGGITGSAEGTTEILNSIVRGNLNATLSVDAEKYIGGIAGYMESSAVITNCLSAIDLTGTVTGINAANYGGIVGGIAAGGTVTITVIGGVPTPIPDHTGLAEVTASGNLSFNHGVSSADTGVMRAGGVAGYIQSTTNNRDLVFTGSLTVAKIGSGQDYIGGICGHSNSQNGSNRYSELMVCGSITVPNTFTSGAVVYLGGLMGWSQNAVTRDSWVSSNISEAKAGGGEIRLGGIIGNVDSSEITNCWYEQGSLSSNGGGRLYFGGGFGYAGNGSTITACRSLALLVSSLRTDRVDAGGLVGYMEKADLITSYARTEVRAVGSYVTAGGLIGVWHSTGNDNIEISESYAAGNVSASSTGFYYSLAAGGLIGIMSRGAGSGTSTLRNSYALGNVSADCISGGESVRAGGLVGHVNGTLAGYPFKIQYCFAGGTVSAKSYSNVAIYAGGIVGQFERGSSYNTASVFQNNAAVGTSVTVMGGGSASANRNAGRVFGDSDVGNDYNYALSSMFVGTATTYTNNLYPVFDDDTAPAKTATGKDGVDLSFERFTSDSTATGTGSWLVISMLNFGSQTYGTPSAPAWDTSSMGRGYPLLARLGGQ